MEIKPKYNGATIRINAPIKKKEFNNKVVSDPSGVIPNGIYRVIRWEKTSQIFNIAVSSGLILAMSILIGIYIGVYNKGFWAVLMPIIVSILSIWKLIVSVMDISRLKRQVDRFKEDMKIGLTSQPPFIIRIYRQLFIRQVRHNWATFFLIFNGSIITLLLWWLKDVNWWIFNFKKWISYLFVNPSLMTILFAIALISIAVIHIFFAIERKKRIMEIESFFGETIISGNEIDQLKAQQNKFYRRLFIIYLMIVFIIPIFVKIILRFIRRK